MANIVLPKPDDVAEMFRGLLGRNVTVTPSDEPVDNARTGRYITQDDDLAAAAYADLALVCYSGAALSMVPAGAASDSISEGVPTPVFVENFHEILNVCATLFIDAGSDHVRLDGLVDGDSLPDDLAALVDSPSSVLRVDLEIQGYGTGRLALAAG